MYTQNTLPTDGSTGPFPIGFNYLAGSSISATLYDNAACTLNPVALSFTFAGTVSDDMPAGTTIVLALAQATGKYLKIKKTVSLTSPVLNWNNGTELTKKNLRSNTINMMEMAQSATDSADKAVVDAAYAVAVVDAVAVDAAAAHADMLTAVASAASATASEGAAATSAASALANKNFSDAAVVTTGANLAASDLDKIATNADVVLTHADAASTALDKTATNADVVLSHADVVLTHADAVSTAADRAAVTTLYDNFDDRYLGAKTANPALDNDGNALVAGALYFNTTANEMRVFGTSWNAIGAGGAVGGGTNKAFYENDIIITDDYTITTGKNAMTAGPVTIADAKTVTIPDGSTWSIT